MEEGRVFEVKTSDIHDLVTPSRYSEVRASARSLLRRVITINNGDVVKVFHCVDEIDLIDGDGAASFTWRWTKTPEEILLAEGDIKTITEKPDSSMINTQIGRAHV